jgi:hypothetical protein
MLWMTTNVWIVWDHPGGPVIIMVWGLITMELLMMAIFSFLSLISKIS